jgi:hypothetical protein
MQSEKSENRDNKKNTVCDYYDRSDVKELKTSVFP